MLKEYTLKVVCEIAGSNESHCDEGIQRTIDCIQQICGSTPEITHEEVVEVKRD